MTEGLEKIKEDSTGRSISGPTGSFSDIITPTQPPAPQLPELALKAMQPIFFFSLNHFLYLFLAVLGLRCYSGFSPVVEGGSYSLVVGCGLLTVVASFVVEHKL